LKRVSETQRSIRNHEALRLKPGSLVSKSLSPSGRSNLQIQTKVSILFDFWLVKEYEFRKSRNHLLQVRRGMGFQYYACAEKSKFSSNVGCHWHFQFSLFLDNLCVFLLLGTFHVIELDWKIELLLDL
jgi:hypothetical protein